MKTLSILLTAILFSNYSIAQNCKFEIGLHTGPNLANMRYESSKRNANSSPQIAGTLGIFFQYNITNTFSFRTDPSYERLSEKSGKITATDANGRIIAKGTAYSRYDYISIPILVRASIGNKIKYFVNAGPNLGFLLNQISISDWSTQKIKTTNTRLHETLNWGITGGIGMVLPVKEKFSLTGEFRNTLGLSNISTSNARYSGIKTNVTSLLIGFSYKIDKNSSRKETFSPVF